MPAPGKTRAPVLRWLRSRWLWIALLVAALAVASMLLPVDDWIAALQRWVRQLGDWGLVAFLLFYVAAVVLLVPGSALTIAAGLIYGWWGLAVALTAATAGASLAFLIARYLARARVRALIADRRLLQAVTSAVSAEGWKIVALVRLSPLVPFNLQNYFFGVTDIPFVHYMLATLIGMVPGAALNIYIARFGSGFVEDDGRTLLQWGFFTFGLAVSVLVTWMVSRRAQQELEKMEVNADT